MLGDTRIIERQMDRLIQEIQELKVLLREFISRQPKCTCYGREAGETWTCEVHGFVTRTKPQ